MAWLNADNAQKRLALTADLLAQANLALDLATTRYNLSSLVELSQAQLHRRRPKSEPPAPSTNTRSNALSWTIR